MEDAAILSGIFSDDEEEQDNGDCFTENSDTTKDMMTKRPTCAKKLSTDYATDDLEYDAAGEGHSDSASHTRPGKRPQQKTTSRKKAKSTIPNDPVREDNIDDINGDLKPTTRTKRRKSKRAASSTNTADDGTAGDDSVTADSTTSSKRGSKKKPGSVQSRKKVKLAPNRDTDEGVYKGNSDDTTSKSNTNYTKRGKSSYPKKLTKTPDGEEKGESRESDCQPDSSTLASRKAKKTVSRKMLTKTKKFKMIEHIRCLNPTAIAVMAINEVTHSLPDREVRLREVCFNITPSATVFYVKHLQEIYETFYNECSLMKDRYLHFQLKWHNHCGIFLLKCNQELTAMGLHPSDPLAEKVVSVRAQWNRICIPYSLSQNEKKKFVMLYSSAVFNYFLRQCHRILQKEQETTEISEDGKDTYLRFGGAALATMLHLRYDKMRASNLDDEKRRHVSEEITILQRINSYTKEHIPDYLRYRDNGHMYFPCPEMLPFLTAVDLSTQESANEASFKEHGAEMLHVVSDTLQKANHLKFLFVDLLVIKVPEFDDLSQISINNVYCELVRKLSNTRINEFIDSFKQRAAASKGMATLAGQNLRDSLLSHHVNLKTHVERQ